MKARYQGSDVKVLDAKSGWIKIELDGGEVRSVRRGELEYLNDDGSAAAEPAASPSEVVTPAAEAAASDSQPKEEKTMEAKKAKAPKTTSKAKPAKKAAKKAASKPAAKRVANGAAATATMRTVDGKEYSYERAGKTASGNVAYDNGDEVAQKLRGKSIDEVYTITAKAMLKKGNLKGDFAKCETADQIEKKLKASLKDANLGRQRMTLGNRLRAALKTA